MTGLPNVMKGVYLTAHGGPEMLSWREDIPVPRPGPGEILVRVLAAGVNNTDINTRIGWYSADVTGATDSVDHDVEAGGWGGALGFPRIQGGDICGEVVALGADATTVKLGQRVTSQINIPRPTTDNPVRFEALGSEMDGAFAQFCLLQADEVFDVTTSPLSDAEIAAMPCAFGTAWNLLTRGGVDAGQSVLVTGASGGVGLAAVQLATHLGAQVTGLSSPPKAAAVRSAGADQVLGRDASLPQDTFDVVIDIVGGPVWPDLIRALKPGGHYAVSGAIAGPIVAADLREIYLRDITLHGCSFQSNAVFAGLIDLINSGAIRPHISRTFAMADIAEAQAVFMTKSEVGKIVLLPPEAP